MTVNESKPLIICIAGRSGSGKTTMSEYINNEYDIKMIESYTDRPPRFEGEPGHIFISSEEFDKIDEEDMIAFTKFGGNRYCCLHEDVESENTYVIDEKGIDFLKEKYSDIYNIVTVYIHRPEKLRDASEKRKKRDEKMFYKTPDDYDYIITNVYDNIEPFKTEITAVLRKIYLDNI